MKLPTPRKRGDAYRIEIMIDGQRMSATRDTIKECHNLDSVAIRHFAPDL